ncbi:hypothetical protein BD310DRAFT_909848 [Dichomitus squalens]|uniref:Uncharacterized protein n=1 Tax=Dichomitus squalens TaxID=114155 RepID=A0A4Q9PHA4_9APHY|nr:hypothetical protein BD310DRAFT_909848 [Dichomitus squalens]
MPVAITTGVGPQGDSTIYYQLQPPIPLSQPSSQPTTDENIDPALRGLDVNSLSVPQPATQAVAVDAAPLSAPAPRPVTPTTARLAAAVAKANEAIKSVPKKRTLEEQFAESTRETLQLARDRMQREDADKRAKLDLEQRHVWLSEYQNGLITKEEYRHLARYGKPVASTSSSQNLHISADVITIEEDEHDPPLSGSDDVVGPGWSS